MHVNLPERPWGAHLPPFADAPQQLATSSFLLFLLAGIISVAFLLLPLQDELGSQLPHVLHVSLGQKLVAAYVLGEPSRGARGPLPEKGQEEEGSNMESLSFSTFRSPHHGVPPDLSSSPNPPSPSQAGT